MISDKKRLQVANVCYANVSGMFAMFCNDTMRGPNFRWSEFPNMMAREADLWMMLHNVQGNKQEINETAVQYAREIAETLVTRSGLLDKERSEQ